MPKRVVDTSKLSAAQFRFLFGQIARQKAQKRQRAKRTLSPSVARAKRDYDLLSLRGGEGNKTYTTEDLAKYKKARDVLVKNSAIGQGELIVRLLSKSDKRDFERTKDIHRAKLITVKGNLLYWQVSASTKSPYQHYQVQIRIEGWEEALLSSRTYLSGVKNALKGPVSIECPCGRHQYWYRYIATAGNYAISPLERAFPKLRNPNLEGRCCKHVIKTLKKLESPAVHKELANKMEIQAKRIEFGGNNEEALYFGTEQASRMERGRKNKVDESDMAKAEKAYEAYLRDQKSFNKKMKKKDVQEQNRKKSAAISGKRNKAAAKKRFEGQVNQLKGALKFGESMNMKREDIINKYAKSQNMKLADVKALAGKI